MIGKKSDHHSATSARLQSLINSHSWTHRWIDRPTITKVEATRTFRSHIAERCSINNNEEINLSWSGRKAAEVAELAAQIAVIDPFRAE
jgi:hypothetical protein